MSFGSSSHTFSLVMQLPIRIILWWLFLFVQYKSLATFIELQSTCSQDRRPVFKPPITDGDGYLISSCFLVIALLYHAAHTLSLRPTPIARGRYSLLSLGRVTPLRTLKGITPLSRQTQRRRAWGKVISPNALVTDEDSGNNSLYLSIPLSISPFFF